MARIGIVGAGIGGLAAAALLTDAGHRVTLVERFAVPRPHGLHRLAGRRGCEGC